MSRTRKTAGFSSASIALALAVMFVAGLTPSLADRVELRDGSVYEGRVVTLDENRLVLELANGREERFARVDLASIEFDQEEPPEVRVRVRVRVADDLVRLYLDGAEIADPAQIATEWIELGPLLAEGANLLEAEVENESGTWSYQWVLDAGEQKETFACGVRGKVGCRRDGTLGTEIGLFPAGRVWIYLDRASGELTLQVDER